MRKSLCLLLAMLLLINGLNPRLALGEEGQEILEDLVTVEIDGEEVQMTKEEHEKYIEEMIEKAFRQAVKREEDKDIKELTHGYLLGDCETGEILYGNNIDQMLAIASITKVITVYVVLDKVEEGLISLDDMVTIDAEVVALGGSSYDLKEGEEVSVYDLIKAAMVISGNDATRALAKHVAGSEGDFIPLMEEKLESLGINQYNIVNVSGLPKYNPDTQNMMTIRDLFKLSRNFIRDYPKILEITSLPGIIEPERGFDEENTNPILGEVEGVDGLKTGYIGAAGRCMLATGARPGVFDNTKDIRLIGITMGSENDAQRYVAIKRIMDHGLDNYMQKFIATDEEPVARVKGVNTIPSEIALYAQSPSLLPMRKDQEITFETEVVEIVPPIEAGSVVGKVRYYLDGDQVYETNLVTKEAIIDPSIKGRLFRFYQNGFNNIIEIFA